MVPPLPEELLVLILEEFTLQAYDPDCPGIMGMWRLGPRSCLTTLRNACLASKALHRLAWPILYRHFNSNEWMLTAQKLDTVQFLQTICTRPEKGLALRSLSIEQWEPVDAMDPAELFRSLQGDATLVDLFQWRAKTLWLGEDHTASVSPGELRPDGNLISVLLRSLEMGLPEAHSALLLLLSPKLRTLVITTPSHFETSMIARLLDITLSGEFRTMTPPEDIHDPDQEESDYAIAQMFGASWPATALQKPNLFQELVECTIGGPGRCPSGLKFFRNLISLPALRYVTLFGLRGGSDNATRDLEMSLPRTQLRSLTIHTCQLLTSETIAVIRCCPGLVLLDLIWHGLGGHDNSHSQSSERDQRLQFGLIADAIATHTPKLELLRLSASHWPYRYLSSEYPYTVGKSLQQLKHLKRLQLDDFMVYGMQPLEEPPVDHHVSQSSINSCTLGQVVPKAIESVNIGTSDLIRNLNGGGGSTDGWQDWQTRDLQRFLQDESFESLHKFLFMYTSDMSKEYINEAFAKHGWEAIPGINDGRYCRFRNRARGGNTGSRRFEPWLT